MGKTPLEAGNTKLGSRVRSNANDSASRVIYRFNWREAVFGIRKSNKEARNLEAIQQFLLRFHEADRPEINPTRGRHYQ